MSVARSPAAARAPGRAHEVNHRLRLVIAAPSPPGIMRTWQQRFGVETFSGGYALTEGGPVGRVLKHVLRDEGVTPATWDREAAGLSFDRR